MKLLSIGGGFSDDEIRSYKYIVFTNCITQMKAIATVALTLKFDFDSEANQVKLVT